MDSEQEDENNHLLFKECHIKLNEYMKEPAYNPWEVRYVFKYCCVKCKFFEYRASMSASF